MLLKTHSLSKPRALRAIAFAVLALSALSAISAGAAELTPAPVTAPFVPYSDFSKVSPEQMQEAQKLGESVVRDILEAYETRRTPEMDNFANKTRKKMDSIADEAMAADRDQVLEFLGLDPNASTGLYFFVSWSMPLEMLRSVAIEAMWSGGSLIFKGVPPGKDLGEFITKDLQQLVYGKGAAANISIDPRLFDAYQVKTVPSVVFTMVKDDMQCQGVSPVAVQLEGGKTATYDTCPSLDPATYWQVTGAVTTNYALQSFIDAGAAQAKPYLAALSRGWTGQAAPGKEQRAFTGRWEDALSPSEKLTARDTAAAISRYPATPAPGAP